MWRVTLAGLRANKLRVLTTSIAVILGVGFMAGTLTLRESLSRTVDAVFAQVTEEIDIVVRQPARFSGFWFGEQRPDLPAGTVAAVEAVPGVDAAAGVVSGSAQFLRQDGEPIGSAFGAPPLAQNWLGDTRLNSYVLADGRAPEGPGEVVMDRGTARANDFAVGDEIQVVVGGVARPFDLVGIARFGDLDSQAGATTALFETVTLQAMLGRPDAFSMVVAAGDGSVPDDQLAESVRTNMIGAVVGEGVDGMVGVEVITGDELADETESAVRDLLDNLGTVLLVFVVVALFVGSYTIANTFSILVAQRTRELALLRAVGARRGQVLRAVVGEAAAVGAVGGLVGLIGGTALASILAKLINGWVLGTPRGGYVLEPPFAVLSLAIGTLVTVVAALWPAWRASRVPPLAALRDVSIDRASRARWRVVLGIVLTFLGVDALVAGLFLVDENELLLVGVGVLGIFVGITVLGPVLATPAARVLGAPLPRLRGITGTLARANAMRNPTRMASTAAALMIGVALVTLLFVMIASIQGEIEETVGAQFRGDLVLDTASDAAALMNGAGVDPELTAAVAELPEVDAASGLRITLGQVAGRAGGMVGVDHTQAFDIVDLGILEGSPDGLGEAGIALSREFAEGSLLSVGDPVAVTWIETGVQVFTVSMIFEERELYGDAVVGMGSFEANVPGSLDIQVYVTARDGVPLGEVTAAVERAADAYPQVRVQDRQEFIDAQSAPLRPLLLLFTTLLSFAVVIALFGIANTLALSVFERTREIGLLRAVGMTRRQVGATVRWESVLISLFGTFLGVVIGVFFARVLILALADDGFDRFVLPVTWLLLGWVVAAAAGVVTGLWPARRAARLDVLSAIATE
jgi:putative ABC transport system permease protein